MKFNISWIFLKNEQQKNAYDILFLEASPPPLRFSDFPSFLSKSRKDFPANQNL